MSIDVMVGRHPSTLEVAGDLDLEGGDELEARVQPLLELGASVQIQLRDVVFIDSSGVGALLAVLQQAEERGASVVLVSPSEVVMAVLRMTETADLFRVLYLGDDATPP